MVSAVVSIKSCLLTCSCCIQLVKSPVRLVRSSGLSEVMTAVSKHSVDSAVIVTRQLANFKMVERVSFDGATLFFMLS